MIISIYKNRRKLNWIISPTTLILLAINLVFLTTACTTPHAVRDGSGYRSFKSEKANKTNDSDKKQDTSPDYQYARAEIGRAHV